MSGCMNRVQAFFSLYLVFIIMPSCVIVLSALICVWGEWHFLACMCSQTFERSSKAFVLWCWGTDGKQTSLFWCPINVKMSNVIADDNKRQTSFTPDRRKTFPTDQIKSQAWERPGKGDTVSIVKCTHPWEKQESKLTSNICVTHRWQYLSEYRETVFLFWIISSCFPAESRVTQSVSRGGYEWRESALLGEGLSTWSNSSQQNQILI